MPTNDSTMERIAKLAFGEFTWEDLSAAVQRMVPKSATVTMLEVGMWTRVGDYWLLNHEIASDPDDDFARISVRRHKSFLTPLTLPFVRDKGNWHIWASTVENTPIVIDIWYVGNGATRAALAVQKG